MKVKRLLPPIISVVLCFGLVNVVEYVDTNFITQHTFLKVSVMLILLTSIPIIIVLNIVYLLYKSSDDEYYDVYRANSNQLPNHPSWMEYRNYENLEKIRQAVEVKNVNSNDNS